MITKSHRNIHSLSLALPAVKHIMNALPDLPLGASVDVVVGANFRRLASASGQSHVEVARALGLNPRALSAIERGKIRAGGRLVIRAARLFGVQPSSFFDVVSFKGTLDGTNQSQLQRTQRVNRYPKVILCQKPQNRESC
jgi:transcriptional regulator with XRE-family HTH domain